MQKAGESSEKLRGVTFALVGLGCPKNDVDAEYLAGLLEAAGARMVEDPAEADVILVNTCAFIEPAVREALEALEEAASLKEAGVRAVICAGCLPQRYREQLARELPEIDGFMGPGAVGRVVEVVARVLAGERVLELPPPSFLGSCATPRVRTDVPWTAYVKIADGCSHPCTFCTIPAIRGPYRSRPVEDVVAEAVRLAEEGAVELCLVSQDSTSYGADLGLDEGLARLVEQMAEELGRRGFEGWIRVQYLHPDKLTQRAMEALCGGEPVVPYFDLPFQHASQRILRAMGRAGSGEAYLELVSRIRELRPEAAIRATFIVGFPGETEGDFQELLDFVARLQPDHVAVFPYWPEEGTPAAEMAGQVEEAERRRRAEALTEAALAAAAERGRWYVGRKMKVLVEEAHEGAAVGRSLRDAPEVDGSFTVSGADARPGEFVWAVVEEADEHDLIGRRA